MRPVVSRGRVNSIVAMTNSRSLISPTTVLVSHDASTEIPGRHWWPAKGGPLKIDKATTSLRIIGSIALLPNEWRLSCGAGLEYSQGEFYHTARKTFSGSLRTGAASFKRMLRGWRLTCA